MTGTPACKLPTGAALPSLAVIDGRIDHSAISVSRSVDIPLAIGTLRYYAVSRPQMERVLGYVGGAREQGADEITMPFGGFKQSGFGRDGSLHALHKYADLKSVSFRIAQR